MILLTSGCRNKPRANVLMINSGSRCLRSKIPQEPDMQLLITKWKFINLDMLITPKLNVCCTKLVDMQIKLDHGHAKEWVAMA